MAARSKAMDRGRWAAAEMVAEIAREARTARLAAGLSQSAVARAANVSQSTVSRIEGGSDSSFRVDALVRQFAVLGLRLSIRAYPEGDAIRDRAHVALLARLRAALPRVWRWTIEAPVGGAGDLRAWDARLDGPVAIGVEAETRLHDIQATQRRIQLKARDGRVDRLILLVAETRHNAGVLREHRDGLRDAFPLEGRAVLAALRAGRDPGANDIVIL